MGVHDYNLWADRRSPYFVLPGQRKKSLPPVGQEHHLPFSPALRKRIGHKKRSVDFNKYAAEGNQFMNEVAAILRCDRGTAGRVTSAVLQALRDNLPPNDAVEFAQGFPMALKGLYFDQYDLSRTPVGIRHRDDFINYIRTKNHFTMMRDFYTPYDVVLALQAVFQVLEQHMEPGQTGQVKRLLPEEISRLLEKY